MRASSSVSESSPSSARPGADNGEYDVYRARYNYGTVTLEEAMERLRVRATADGVELEVVTSNHEGDLVDRMHEIVREQGASDVKAVIVNPGGATAYSVAVLDALIAANLPVVEVHISNRYKKPGGEIREKDLISRLAVGQVVGLGVQGYEFALEWLLTNVFADGS